MLNGSNLFGGKTEKKSPAFGIDLGTTNSCISIFKEGSLPEVIPMRNGKPTLPSCVMYMDKDSKPVVGQEAYVNRGKKSVVYSVKKLMGTEKKVEVVAENGDKLTLHPYEVSAEILKALVENISDRYKVVEDVVITVPADFNSKQVDDTLKAAKLANLNVLQVLREPTAGSLALNLDSKINGDFLVYDLGGGTFDASLIYLSCPTKSTDDLFGDIYGFSGLGSEDNNKSKDIASDYIVKATRGDVNLGGDDLDEIMLNIVLERLKSKGVQLRYMPEYVKENLKLRLEMRKKDCIDDIVIMNVNYKPIRGKEVNEDVYVYPNDFYKATLEIFNRTKVYIDEVLKEFSTNLKGIVTIGGSTKNKILKELLELNYNIRVFDDLNPDEAVSLGAAVQSSNLKFGGSNINILDVLSHGIGVLADGRITNIIPRDVAVPTSFTRAFGTSRDNQEQVDIHVYSGNSTVPEECVYLGTLNVDNIPKGKVGEVFIKVNLSIDSSGSLECYVVSKGVKKKAVLTNVLGSSSALNSTPSKNLTLNEKKVIRWSNFAEKLQNENDREYLLDLIDEFRLDTSVENKIIDFMREKKKENLRQASAPKAHLLMRSSTLEETLEGDSDD